MGDVPSHLLLEIGVLARVRVHRLRLRLFAWSEFEELKSADAETFLPIGNPMVCHLVEAAIPVTASCSPPGLSLDLQSFDHANWIAEALRYNQSRISSSVSD